MVFKYNIGKTSSAMDRLVRGNRMFMDELKNDENLASLVKDDQRPDFLWIGCSDSRVVPNLMTGMKPGEMFIHRNVGNQCPANDVNVQAVIEYAVEHLKVRHIVVCGHYQCGAVKAALGERLSGTLETWVTGVREVRKQHDEELGRLPSL